MRFLAARVFSGLHMGAEMELGEGTFVIGTDESCDLILSDSTLAGRHAAFYVSMGEEHPSVEIEPLDGSVFIGKKLLAERSSLPPAQPFRLASVIMAWAESTASGAETWPAVEALIASESASPGEAPSTGGDTGGNGDGDDDETERQESPAPEEKASDGDEEPGLDTTEASASADAGNAEALKLDVPEEKRGGCLSRMLKWLFLIAALCLVAVLCFSLKETRPAEDHAKTVRKLLDEAGYQKLTVADAGKGVAVSGRIASDSERGRLLKLAQMLQFPVYLNLTVRSDAADAVQASYNAMGLYPEVSELPPSNRTSLFVRGYIRDGVLEEKALAEARRNLPSAWTEGSDKRQKIEIYSEIRHQEEVAALLDPALASLGMQDHVQVRYLPGRVLIRGALTTGMRNSLSSVASDIQQKLGVPVPVDIVNAPVAQAAVSGGALPALPTPSEQVTIKAQKDGQATLPEKSEKTASEENVKVAVQPEKPELPPVPAVQPAAVMRFKVTSVSMGAMKFLTLASGERVFEGGELPGGFIVEKIGVSELTLSKNGRKIVYPLRGGHE